MKSIIRPKTKYKLLDEYIKEGGRIYREDINRMGFNTVDKSIYTYCVNNNIKLKKINELYWIQVDSDLPLGELLNTKYTYLRNKFTEQEIKDVKLLSWDKFHAKYPTRPKASYTARLYKR